MTGPALTGTSEPQWRRFAALVPLPACSCVCSLTPMHVLLLLPPSRQANAKLASVAWESDKLRAVMEVTHGSRPLLRYLATKLLAPLRGDKLYLGRAGARDAANQENVTRCVRVRMRARACV